MFRALVCFLFLISASIEATAGPEFYRFIDVVGQPWTIDEKRAISIALDELASIPAGQALIERVVAEKGPLRLFRGHTVKGVPRAIAAADVHTGSVTFFDRRFDPELLKYDPPMIQTAAHEIAHIFDCLPSNVRNYYCLSGQRPFAKAMRLKTFRIKEEWGTVILSQPKGFSKKDLDQIVAKSRALAKEGKKAEAVLLGQTYAHSLGVPSVYSMSGGTGELLAEVIASTIVDPGANRYLSAESLAWVRRELLHAQR